MAVQVPTGLRYIPAYSTPDRCVFLDDRGGRYDLLRSVVDPTYAAVLEKREARAK